MKAFCIFFFVLFVVIFSYSRVEAQLPDNGNPGGMTQDPGTNDGISEKRFLDIRRKIDAMIRTRNAKAIDEIYKFFTTSSGTPITPPQLPPLTPTSGLLPTPTSIFPFPTYPTPQPYLGQIRYYRQCSPENRQVKMSSGCTICDMGCGLTAGATIASTLLNDPSYTPIRMLNIYQSKGYHVQCDGTSIVDSFAFFKTLIGQGIKTTDDYIFRGQAWNYQKAAPYIKRYTDAGWMIVMLARFNGIGHFVVITGVDASSNFTVYDPYYESGMTSQPNTNLNRYKTPDAIYRAAFGVKRVNPKALGE